MPLEQPATPSTYIFKAGSRWKYSFFQLIFPLSVMLGLLQIFKGISRGMPSLIWTEKAYSWLIGAFVLPSVFALFLPLPAFKDFMLLVSVNLIFVSLMLSLVALILWLLEGTFIE